MQGHVLIADWSVAQRPPRHVVIHDVIHDDNEVGNIPISYQDVTLHEYCNFHAAGYVTSLLYQLVCLSVCVVQTYER